MKIKPLLLSGLLAVSSAAPALAHDYYGHHHHPGEYHQPYQPIPGPSQQGPSVLGTLLGIGLVGAGLYWGYGPDIQYESGGKTYVLCNDFGRRYYC